MMIMMLIVYLPTYLPTLQIQSRPGLAKYSVSQVQIHRR